MTVSYKVGVPHHNGDSVSSETIKPEDIKSNQIGKPGDARPNLVSLDGVYKPIIERGPYGEVYAVTRTANNKFKTLITDYFKPGHGYFSQIDDGVIRGKYQFPTFDSWKSAGEKYGPAYFNYVKLPEQTSASGVMESFRERRATFPVEHTPLPKYVHDVKVVNIHNNRLGAYLHHIKNLQQRVTKYFGTKIAQLIADEEIKSGKPVEDISRLGVGFLPERALYGIDRIEDGRILLTVAEDAFDIIARDARAFGIDTESYIETILAEEHAHKVRGDFDKEGDDESIETEAKSLVYRKLLELAKGAEGGNPRNPKYERERRRRQIQAEIKGYDIKTTPERYGKRAFYKELYSKDRSALEAILASEAVDNGYSGEEVREYVAKHLKEIGEDGEVKSGRTSRLEKIVEKEANPERAEPAETSASE